MGKIFLICTIKPKIEFVHQKLNQIDLFYQIDTRVLAILWASLLALFSVSKDPLLIVFSDPNVDKRPRNLRFSVKNLPILPILMGHFRPFQGLISRFLDFFKVI